MKIKILILGLICLFVFAYCESPADPQIEKALNPSNPDLPVIEYFNVLNQRGNVFTLSWSVTNATTVSIDQRIGEVEATGYIDGIQIIETTTYKLTAINSDGQKTASVIADLSGRALLEVSTIPEVPVFYYCSSFDNSQSCFTVIVTETNGVGGYIHSTISFDSGECGWPIPKKTFEPFSSISVLYDACAESRPTTMTIWVTGWDDNNCEINMQVNVPVIIEN